jgi:hypothetical protein
MRHIAPGHWVRIRAKSRLALGEIAAMARSSSKGQDSVRVGAVWTPSRVSFGVQNGNYHETFVPTEQETRSTNAMPIHLELAETP